MLGRSGSPLGRKREGNAADLGGYYIIIIIPSFILSVTFSSVPNRGKGEATKGLVRAGAVCARSSAAAVQLCDFFFAESEGRVRAARALGEN
ncbi:Hypothetical predicted protein [Podarcis lilfordi]|uniref:Uncharacterized protein n=1 Tax=Podarcis lilfordi TaxID=74358 RepID=A0AA35P6V5_9SAUR|nr:Hypothetical predicted protein [Podarcis lilfordi]